MSTVFRLFQKLVEFLLEILDRNFVQCHILILLLHFIFFFSSRRRHTRCSRDWSSDVCSSDLQRLLEPARQLELLDRFADTEELRERVAGLVATFRAARAETERMRAAERDRAQREDLLRFQLSELDGARLRPGEEEELRQERRRRQHADKLTAGLADVAALLDDDRDSATARLHRAARVLGDLARLDPAFAAPIEPLDAARAQLEEVRAAVRGLRDSTLEPGRLEGIDERLDALTRLKRKYGDTEEAMVKFRDEV